MDELQKHYKEKYLKYKTKYLALLNSKNINSFGGVPDTN